MFTVQVVSVATVRLIPIVLAMKVVAAANAHPATAGVLLVLTTLTAEFGKDAVTELANTHMKIVMIMNHSSFQLAGIIIGLIFFTCLIVACICGQLIGSRGHEQTHWRIRSRRTTTPDTTKRVAHPPTNPPQGVTATIYTRRVVQRSYQQG